MSIDSESKHKSALAEATDMTYKVTEKFLEEQFCVYNELCFDGVLKMPMFNIYTSRCGPVAMFRQKGEKKRPCIWINNSIDWTKDSLIDTIIHEMIHQYVRIVIRYDGMFSHGYNFLKMRRKIRKKHGIRVSLNGRHLKYKNPK